MVLRIAMWSGPRNISTAMMRSWGNRPDTLVCDEPLYAHYLQHTNLPHPGRDEVISTTRPIGKGRSMAHRTSATRQNDLLSEAHEPSPAAQHRIGLDHAVNELLLDSRTPRDVNFATRVYSSADTIRHRPAATVEAIRNGPTANRQNANGFGCA